MLRKALLFAVGVFSAHFLIADDQIMIPNSTVNATSPTRVQAIVLDANGNMTEQQYMYDPDTEVIIINSNTGGDNASIFFPLFSTGFIWWNGYWVNHDGYYYHDDHWIQVNNADWNNHWNGYWNNHWDNHWHNHWNNHRQDHNFRYRKQEHWPDRSFQGNRGGHREGGGGERRGGGGGHR